MRCSPAEKRDPMESEVPQCPDDCWYLKSFGGHWPYCDYWAMEDRMRGCEPGPGCKRYVARHTPYKSHRGKAPTWDVETGRKMWEEGYTDAQIGKELGVRRDTVAGYRERNWGQLNRQRQKKA